MNTTKPTFKTYAELEAAFAARGYPPAPKLVELEEMIANGWTVNQWRAARDLKPHPDGDRPITELAVKPLDDIA